jgi:uncharacterized cupin superfamily protein
MERLPGVFVSNISTSYWERDAGVGGESHSLCAADEVEAGLWRVTGTSRPLAWNFAARETILVIEGFATIEFADGSQLELGPGDIASIPEGAETTWHIMTPFKQFRITAQRSQTTSGETRDEVECCP